MLTEGLIVGTVAYLYLEWDKIVLRRRWRGITSCNNKFTNNLGKTLKILKINREPYGFRLEIELPYGYTLDNLENDIEIFREGLHFDSIQIENNYNVTTLYCIKKYNFKDYKPMKLPPSKLLIADGLTNPIIVDMNNFPHIIIGGDTGTGKSRILLLILTNIIKYCTNVDIYLLQVRKNDLGVFNNCKQVKVNSKSMEEVLDSLEAIDMECRRREILVDNTKGYYNIEDYNNKSGNKKMNYIYVVIEEFSFLNINRGDSKEEKKIKSMCLKHIKTIVNVGRSSGVFLITALQKPTNDSIPSDIKAQLCTRVSLLIKDAPSARVILGNENNTKLCNREVIVRTLREQKGYSYTITHDIIKENIKFMEVRKIKNNNNNKNVNRNNKNEENINTKTTMDNLSEIMEVLNKNETN